MTLWTAPKGAAAGSIFSNSVVRLLVASAIGSQLIAQLFARPSTGGGEKPGIG
jgi:hypothetical protein